MDAITALLREEYGLSPISLQKSKVGAGSDTYFATCESGKYVLKFPAVSPMNNPEAEAELCGFLREKSIPASEFLRNKHGAYLSTAADGRVCHVQFFVEGETPALNTAPDWLLDQSAKLLGRIHTALRDYQGLPVGIGEDFFKYMTPPQALASYQRTLKIALDRGDLAVADDLRYRIALMERFPAYTFDLGRLTCQGTHGDYFISQLIVGEHQINAVIDWTTACVHPVVWEILRSYLYAAPSCAQGDIDEDGLIAYVRAYLTSAPLTKYDLSMMPLLFTYQIVVCDYYDQYYQSDADNRHIYLHQATFSTKLLRCLEKRAAILSERLAAL